MPDEPRPTEIEDVLRLAAEHGLQLEDASVRFEEAGLDFRVAFARAHDGTDWVLRIPRRPDVLARAAVEHRLLDAVAPHLDVAVPRWRISTETLIAYPLLPGTPGLTVAGDGTVTWAVDMASPVYARSLGTVVAQLHTLDVTEAAATGIEVRSPEQVRTAWQHDLDRVAAAFPIAPELHRRWQDWIDEDTFWPSHSVLTHGEIYPAHTLIEDEEITAILDWTTAAVGDPARDLQFHQAVAPPEIFEVLLEAYVAGGGGTWPRLAEHCAEQFSAAPIGYGIFALETGEAAHRDAAAALLDPPQES